jgi:hypothetical protein
MVMKDTRCNRIGDMMAMKNNKCKAQFTCKIPTDKREDIMGPIGKLASRKECQGKLRCRLYPSSLNNILWHTPS